ncbi:ABC transporter ATP-binding protein [Thalassomonas sp. RHCl1]|uniref:ABC transporter ATP-binding protein n=1 Tax=Thalassomonas sp. RHCl1 TaxID=2995320 RepID=UPI00248D07FC|nr:ABC transporter ATP-binding protein [Thalassomonas sp. RHCl1]
MSSYIELKNVSQSFHVNESKVTLFQELNLSICQGQSYAITGPSGAGKSSLLMLMSGLESPTSGQGVYVKGEQRKSLDFLRPDIGFIFQQFHLLPELTAVNNVALPLKLRGDKEAEDKARLWLNKVGLTHRINHKPSELSGGEQQRVAIARALVFEPRFIFADEPTGNLDQQSATEIADILFSCCRENNAGLVVVTHSEELANRAEHIFSLSGGKIKAQVNDVLKAVSC